MDVKKMSQAIAAAMAEKKAKDIVLMGMEKVMLSADFFIIGSAQTATQVRAIADNVEEKMAEAGVEMLHKEGYRQGEWVLLDYGYCVAHIFITDSREFYALENLWADAPLTRYED